MTAGSDTPQIVVADDDLLLSSRVSASLEQLGYRAVVVRSAEALDAAVHARPRAVIMNLAVRGFDAPGAIRRIKADRATRGIPLIGFCGHRDTERARAAELAGCDTVTTNGAVALARALHGVLDSTLSPNDTV